jgi:hypothetical protein
MSQTGTRHRQFRAEGYLWSPAIDKAQRLRIADGLSEVLRAFLDDWNAKPDDIALAEHQARHAAMVARSSIAPPTASPVTDG